VLEGDVLGLVLDALPISELHRPSGCRRCARDWHREASQIAARRERAFPLLNELRMLASGTFAARETDDAELKASGYTPLCLWLAPHRSLAAQLAGERTSPLALLSEAERLSRAQSGQMRLRLRGLYNGDRGAWQADIWLHAVAASGSYSARVDSRTSFFVDHLRSPGMLVLGAMGAMRSHAAPARPPEHAPTRPGHPPTDDEVAIEGTRWPPCPASGAEHARPLRAFVEGGSCLTLLFSLSDADLDGAAEAAAEAAAAAAADAGGSVDARADAGSAAGHAAISARDCQRWYWTDLRFEAGSGVQQREALEARFLAACASAFLNLGQAVRERSHNLVQLGLGSAIDDFAGGALARHCLPSLAALAVAALGAACSSASPAKDAETRSHAEERGGFDAERVRAGLAQLLAQEERQPGPRETGLRALVHESAGAILALLAEGRLAAADAFPFAVHVSPGRRAVAGHRSALRTRTLARHAAQCVDTLQKTFGGRTR
jgi:hypothetical protein